MNPTTAVIEGNDTVVSQNHLSAISQSAKSMPLRDAVRAAIREYFVRLEGATPVNLYELFIAEIEAPLLEVMLRFTQANQSQAARYLNLSRGTLRKKMKQYGFLDQQGKKNRSVIQDANG